MAQNLDPEPAVHLHSQGATVLTRPDIRRTPPVPGHLDRLARKRLFIAAATAGTIAAHAEVQRSVVEADAALEAVWQAGVERSVTGRSTADLRPRV